MSKVVRVRSIQVLCGGASIRMFSVWLVLLSFKLVQASPGSLINEVSHRYTKAPMVTSRITKTVKQIVLEKEKIQKGDFFFRRGQLKLDFHSPERAEVYVDGKHVWMLAYPPKGFIDAPAQVTKIGVKKDRGSAALLNLLSLSSTEREFKISLLPERENIKVFDLDASQHEVLGLKRAQVFIHPEAKTIGKLVYWDDLENETVYEFSEINLKAKVKSEIFKIQIPKGAQVTEL